LTAGIDNVVSKCRKFTIFHHITSSLDPLMIQCKSTGLFIMIFVTLFFWTCSEESPMMSVPMIPNPTPAEEIEIAHAVIPEPSFIELGQAGYEVTISTDIYVNGDSEGLMAISQDLRDQLIRATGFDDIDIISTTSPPTEDYLFLTTSDIDPLRGDEGYDMELLDDGVTISANDERGIFYGIQTLKQLLPGGIESSSIQNEQWVLPVGMISDRPRYSYRGAMLDVVRHFFEVDIVKRYIDLMALYKLNTLHIHLTDDQGWRLEINSWPDLTRIGGSTEVDGGPGGYYTQEDYIEIVEYAQERFIEVIPEIDMPGHTTAALASYPELNCDGIAPPLFTGTQVGFSSLCLEKEITFRFIDDVIRELVSLTPGRYIHIGGDEAPVPESGYVEFITRAQEIVEQHDKQMIGWDEIATAGLGRSAVVQYWLSLDNARSASFDNSMIIASPFFRSYLNLKYDLSQDFGASINTAITTQEAYDWNPSRLLSGVNSSSILGVEAPLWTEEISTLSEIERLAFPRLIGIAEIGWSSSTSLDWESYKLKLGRQKNRLEALGVNYFVSPLVPWINE